MPVLIGSGITNENVKNYYLNANGFIVGSHFKESGKWWENLNVDRIRNFMKIVNDLHKFHGKN